MGLTISYTLTARQSLSEAAVLKFTEHTATLALQIGCTQAQGPEFGGPPDWKIWQLPDGSWTGEPRSPVEGYSVSILPGYGCEHATFGLCRYEDVPGWKLTAFCKTQYAARYGVDHFLHCHRRVISLLDLWHDFGVELEVCDEGEYWETRSVECLRQRAGVYDRLVAAVAGTISDGTAEQGVKIAAEIFDDVRFERLEAEGRAQFARQLAELKEELERLR